LLQFAITRVITVAAGRFAPGHLGELTQQVPFDMVDAVLADTRTAQRRVRGLPSRVVVYLLLAGCLFAELGYRQVWHRLVAGLDGLHVPTPSEAGLTKARRRVGVAPLRVLFDLLRGPAATTAGPVRWHRLLVCAIDGTIMSVPDSPANLTRYGKQRGGVTGGSSYPMLRLVAVVACGTRTIIDAVFGPISHGETTYARQLTDACAAGCWSWPIATSPPDTYSPPSPAPARTCWYAPAPTAAVRSWPCCAATATAPTAPRSAAGWFASSRPRSP